ncbi:MAG: condensation domain-containing protein, partial [Firmicutes bacterium]|nr:condensation domain-containing protein [Bacillota bacterium]
MNRYEDDRIFPISQSQSNIWKLEQLYPHNPMNNICTSIRIKGRIDIALAARSINSVLEKDLSLRMRMATVNGKLVQYHVPYKEEQFPFFNFSMTDEEGFSRWENTIAQVPMPICDSPLYQFSIYKFDEKSGGILIKVHHLIADGWSIVDLANRLSSAYLALLSRKEFELPDMPSYERHVAQEREYFASEAFDTDRAYWAGRIAEFEGERAFLKKNSNVNVSNAGDRCSFKFSELTNHAIAAFCRSNRIAPFAVYCIALAVHLRRMSGFDRACIGVPIVNRAEFTDKQAGGMFVNTLPFFFRVNTALSAQDMIFDLTEQWYALLRHQRFPFSEIFALAGQNRADGAPNRLFDIVLSYQDSKIFRDRDTTMLFSGKWLYSGYQNEQLIIHLSSLDGENRFAVDYDYQTQIFSREDICDLHNHVTQILTEILLNQNLPAAGLNLLDESELERVLYTFNNTKNDYLSTTIGEEFLKVAAGSPGKAALICKDAKLTFGELYRRAAAVAGHIRSVCGSLKEKENVVALCLPRGFDLLAFMLGAALSDNAWVVFPSDLPAARLLQLLRDCGAATVITTEAFGAVFEQAS